MKMTSLPKTGLAALTFLTILPMFSAPQNSHISKCSQGGML
jgi:hypothetical protein